MTTLRGALGLAVLGLSSCWGCRPPPDFHCQQGSEGCPPGTYCFFTPGAEPMQWGNPSPLPGFLSDTYECVAAPDRCADPITCACLSCTGEVECGDEPAAVQPVQCSEDEDGTVLVGALLD